MDGGGALMNQGIHGIDMLQWMVGDIESRIPYSRFTGQSYKKEKDKLLKQIGQLSYEVSWLKKNLADSTTREDRTKLVDASNRRLSISRQADLLTISRSIVGFSLSNTLEKGFVIDALKKAMKRHGKPEIVNCDVN